VKLLIVLIINGMGIYFFALLVGVGGGPRLKKKKLHDEKLEYSKVNFIIA